jgi:hypothetical protein
MEVLDPEECLQLIATETLGRLGVVVEGRPEIFPVNFVLAGEHIMIRTDLTTNLRAALEGPIVFEVDHSDVARETGWSVMVHGRAQVTHDPVNRGGPQTGPRPWREVDLPHLLRIVPSKVTGRRLSAPPAHRWPVSGRAGFDPVRDS